MNKIKTILTMAIAVCTVLVGYYFIPYFSSASEFHSLQFLPKPKPLSDFTLENQKGDKVTAEDFNGRWSLVFFGFTSCPDMCPMELQEMAKVLRRAKQHSQIPLQVVFISLDPERDSAPKIADYLGAFNVAMLGLRGAHSELVLLSDFFAVDYTRSAVLAGSPLNIPAGVNMTAAIIGNYQVIHSGRIFIINPQGNYVGSFRQPHNAENIWADLQLIIKR